MAIAVLFAWLPLLLLSLLEGTATGSDVALPLLKDPVPFGRLLVALPLFFVAESLVDQRTSAVVELFDTSSLVPDSSRARWNATLQRLIARSESRLAAAIVIAVTALASVTTVIAPDALESLPLGSGDAWFRTGPVEDRELTWAGLWYAVVALPMARFVAYRWVWRGVIWIAFLWSIARLPLRLLPTHPDRCGGLSALVRAQASFVVVGVAFCAALSANLADVVLHSDSTVAAHRTEIAALVGLTLLLMYGPLLLFSKAAVTAKDRALREYGSVGRALAVRFRERWVESPQVDPADIIDKVDPSAVADYGAAFDTIGEMRVFLVPPPVFIASAGLLALPFVPLWFLGMPAQEVLTRLFGVLM